MEIHEVSTGRHAPAEVLVEIMATDARVPHRCTIRLKGKRQRAILSVDPVSFLTGHEGRAANHRSAPDIRSQASHLRMARRLSRHPLYTPDMPAACTSCLSRQDHLLHRDPSGTHGARARRMMRTEHQRFQNPSESDDDTSILMAARPLELRHARDAKSDRRRQWLRVPTLRRAICYIGLRQCVTYGCPTLLIWTEWTVVRPAPTCGVFRGPWRHGTQCHPVAQQPMSRVRDKIIDIDINPPSARMAAQRTAIFANASLHHTLPTVGTDQVVRR
jgi:hypothetical protein